MQSTKVLCSIIAKEIHFKPIYNVVEITFEEQSTITLRIENYDVEWKNMKI